MFCHPVVAMTLVQDWVKKDPSQAANIYSLMYTLEHLERSYIGGYCKDNEYERECNNVLGLVKLLQDVDKDVFSMFQKEFNLGFDLALNRIKVGFPATQISNIKQQNEKVEIFDLSGYFITFMDALKLKTNSVGELFPLLHVLVDSIQKLECSGPNNQIWNLKSLDRLKGWYSVLDSKKAHEELSEEEMKQLMMDTESAYSSYRSYLQTH